MRIEVPSFKADEIDVKVSKTLIKVEGKHEDKFSSRSFYKEFTIPDGVLASTIQCSLDEVGILTLTAPIVQHPQQGDKRSKSLKSEETRETARVQQMRQQQERQDSLNSDISSLSRDTSTSSRFEDELVLRPKKESQQPTAIQRMEEKSTERKFEVSFNS
jgi:hypothetical protein